MSALAYNKSMRINFNNQLEALYAIDYCVNRRQNIIKQSGSAEEKQFFDEIYRIYLEKVSDVVRDDAQRIGDYHRKAEYVFNKDNPLPDLSAFDDFFQKYRSTQDRIIADITNGPVIKSLHLDALRSFFNISADREINFIPSLFVNSVFSVFNGENNLIIGVNYNPSAARYEIPERRISEIYYEFTRPYVQMALYEKNIGTNGNTEFLVEHITRVLEIIFSTRIYGQQYIEQSLQSQDKMRLGQLRIFLSLYLEKQSKIYNLQNYIQFLMDAGLATQNQ